MRLQLNITQPLMSQTGQLRWALNNVVSLKAPPCEPLLDLLKRWVLLPACGALIMYVPSCELCAHARRCDVRWALGTATAPLRPPAALSHAALSCCAPVLCLLRSDPKWIQRNLVPATTYNAPGFQSSGLGKQEGGSGKVQVRARKQGLARSAARARRLTLAAAARLRVAHPHSHKPPLLLSILLTLARCL